MHTVVVLNTFIFAIFLNFFFVGAKVNELFWIFLYFFSGGTDQEILRGLDKNDIDIEIWDS